MTGHRDEGIGAGAVASASASASAAALAATSAASQAAISASVPREPAETAPAAADRAARVPGSRQVVLWRHGRTAWNLEGRFQGQRVALEETGQGLSP